MNSFNLNGKNIFITGASSGLGKEAAILISQLGGSVIISGRNQNNLNDTFSKLYGDGHGIECADLSNEKDIDELVNKLPQLDGIVYCAGVTGHTPAQFIKHAHISIIFDVNFVAPVLITSLLLRKKKLNKKASIVFVSSVTTRRPYFGGAIYVSSKTAIEGYSKVLSIELATKGIRSNCISPGYVKTAMVKEAEETVSKEVMERIEQEQLMGAGSPADVANAIVYFLSDASTWVTGTNLLLGG
ncbi:MAG: SDR family oxidoreductase [Bacteroidales bacterium]